MREGDTEGSRPAEAGLTLYRLRRKPRAAPALAIDGQYNLRSSQYAGEVPVDLPSYITGYADGEGCFTVSFCKRISMRCGWEVRPSFSVSQNADRNQVLELMLEYFGRGTIRPDRSDHTVKYEVRDIRSLIERILPHFEQYPLMSAKQTDFEHFAVVCRLVYAGEHLTTPGLREIVGRAMAMNPSGKRKFAATEILGGQTSKL